MDADSPSWWVGFRLRYREVQREIRADILSSGLSDSKAEALAKLLEPWRIQASASEDLDLIARWFIIYQPEKLKARGVDLDSIKSQ